MSHKGRLIGDFTVSACPKPSSGLTASYGSQAYHMRWFLQNQTGDVQIENISDTVNGFQLAGPNAAGQLQAVIRSDVSAKKFMDVQEMAAGMVNCVVQRVSYTVTWGMKFTVIQWISAACGRRCGLRVRHSIETLWHAGDDVLAVG